MAAGEAVKQDVNIGPSRRELRAATVMHIEQVLGQQSVIFHRIRLIFIAIKELSTLDGIFPKSF